MSRQQMIDTSFWTDPWIRRIDQESRFVYLYLLTGPATNLAGVYEIAEDRIVYDAGLPAERVKKILRFLESEGKAYRWKDWTILRNWPKHQNIRSPKIQKGIERILEGLPPELLAYLVEIDYKYAGTKEILDRVSGKETTASIPYPYPIDTSSHPTTLHLTTRSPGAGRRMPAPEAPVEGLVARFLKTIGKESEEDLFR